MEQMVCPIEVHNGEDELNCDPWGRLGSAEHFVLFYFIEV